MRISKMTLLWMLVSLGLWGLIIGALALAL
jgi:hypothetical protein